MARGHQKALSQQRNAEKKAKLAKGGTSSKEDAAKSFLFKRVVCMVMLVGAESYKDHFASKHPKAPLPDDIKDG